MFFFKRKESTVRELDYSRPFVVLNFKTYEESQGNNAIRLARIAEKISMKYMINIIVAVQAIDLKEVASKVKIPVYAQHLDSEIPGRSTGSIIPENIKRINVHGSLLNHSEKKLDIKTIEKNSFKNERA
ncbi:MAG: hypothetical protein KatS3mg002_0856 [Candidatus Woesearchaeota archaeon]|nr:MAG: hypothetical protein KatS3mg002_0856 [Candidatus Woesearchaeota archaeon]